MVATQDVSPYVAREMARLYPERWTYDAERHELMVRMALRPGRPKLKTVAPSDDEGSP